MQKRKRKKEKCTLDTVIGLPREIKMIAVRMPQCSPTIKMLNTRTTSSKLPRYPDNSAKARAKAPAVNVPNARLNPLLKVAPALTLILNHFLKKTLILNQFKNMREKREICDCL
jgi:hypothetical protein